MDLPVINSKSKTSVSDVIFKQPVNDELITQLVNSFVANSHQGTKAQKNRSDVRGGGKKPWRQKGTGRARAGTIRSPIWRGGGVTFAARSKSANPKKINKKIQEIEIKEINSKLENEKIDVTLPERNIVQGKIHPVSQVIDELSSIFSEIGFSVEEGPDVENEHYNFTALNTPDNHPARDMHDTFY